MDRLIPVNRLLVLLDREERLLTEDNWHAAAAVVGQSSETIRRLAAKLRAKGIDPDVDE